MAKTANIKQHRYTKEERECKLVEYQKAQDSAEHHDSLIWVVSGLIFAGMFVLMGALLDHLNEPNLTIVNFMIGLVGLVLTLFLGFFQYSFRDIKNQKIEHCKRIEEELGVMKQNSELKYTRGFQTILYRLILFMLLIIWIILLAMIIPPQSSPTPP